MKMTDKECAEFRKMLALMFDGVAKHPNDQNEVLSWVVILEAWIDQHTEKKVKREMGKFIAEHGKLKVR